MSEHRIDSPAPSPTSTASGFSKAAKLAHAAAFAALLVPLSSVPAEASSINCGFGGAGFDPFGAPVPNWVAVQGRQCNPGGFQVPGGEGNGTSENQYVFNFNYALTLEFEDVHGPFHIAVENEEITQAAMATSGRLAAFPGSVCVPIANGSDMCVVFHFSGDTTPGPNTWTGNWTAFISWLDNTNESYPGSSVRVVHARGDDCAPPATCTPNGLNVFDTDITFGPYCAGPPTTDPCPHSPPGFPTDPEIAGTDDNFQSISAISTNVVPEPGSMALLGSGLAALWYRRKRRIDAGL